MAEVIDFTLEINGVDRAVKSVEDLEQAVKDARQAFSQGNFGEAELKSLEKQLQNVERAAQRAGESVKTGARAAGSGAASAKDKVDLLRESFDGAGTAAEILSGNSQEVGNIVSTTMRAISVLNAAREVAENKVTAAILRKLGVEKLAQASQRIMTGLQAAYNVVLSANPIGLVIAAIAALVGAFALLKRPIENFLKEFDSIGKVVDLIIGKLRDLGSLLTFGLIDDNATSKAKANIQSILDQYENLESAANQEINNQTRYVNELKARGGTAIEIFNAEKKLLELKVNREQDTINKLKNFARDLTDEQRTQLGKMKEQVRNYQSDLAVLNSNFQRQEGEKTRAAEQRYLDEKDKRLKEEKSRIQKGQDEILRLEQKYNQLLLDDEVKTMKMLANISDPLGPEEANQMRRMEFMEDIYKQELKALRERGASLDEVRALQARFEMFMYDAQSKTILGKKLKNIDLEEKIENQKAKKLGELRKKELDDELSLIEEQLQKKEITAEAASAKIAIIEKVRRAVDRELADQEGQRKDEFNKKREEAEEEHYNNLAIIQQQYNEQSEGYDKEAAENREKTFNDLFTQIEADMNAALYALEKYREGLEGEGGRFFQNWSKNTLSRTIKVYKDAIEVAKNGLNDLQNQLNRKSKEIAEAEQEQAAGAVVDMDQLYKEKSKILEKYFNFKKNIVDLEKSLDEEVYEGLVMRAEALSGLFRGMMEMTGKDLKRYKAMAITQSILDTLAGIGRALGGSKPPWNYIAAAGVGLAGWANVNKIRNTQTDSADGGGGDTEVQPRKLARGGLLYGPSHGSGGIRTSFGELEGGEFVINKRSTQKYGPLISAINMAGGGKKFDTGGMLGSEAMIGDLMNQVKMNQETPIKTYVVATDVSTALEAQTKIRYKTTL